MPIDKDSLNEIIDNACARATVQFQNEVEAECSKLTSKDGGQWTFAAARCQSVEKALPDMLKTALTVSLAEVLTKLNNLTV